MIKAENLHKRVPMAGRELEILKGINLEIKSGESVAVVGASGSGKSTLLGLLAGLDEASGGRVIIGGTELGQLDEDGRAAFRAENVGFVFQSFQLLPALTALENVMLPLELKGQQDARAQAGYFLERVGLGSRLDHYPRQMSGGEQQRVAIARAFASRPEILFADEPTGNLDASTGAHVIDLLFELNREHGTTLVLVTHDLKLADRCERRLQLEGGALVAQ
ncbi:ABC transporter ATP-binding protein [Parahaliea mediterranea]|uniref:ABC transporter ATP-binding protein n=1 Tax=Parahaliea mediterranea TaxID=651086 RepID=A0A939INX2_9GAMM|nr:ABC transporter ATP-binding protein [Parahaliea mediterranea]MBN7798990.1 ABC transporter ATP-binding protein [Parahaliea mediterranea]